MTDSLIIPERSGRALAGTESAAILSSRDGGENWAERPEVAELRDQSGWYPLYSPEAGCMRGFAFHGDRVLASLSTLTWRPILPDAGWAHTVATVRVR